MHYISRSSKNLTSLQSYNFVGERLAYIQTWGRLRNGQNPRTLDHSAGKMMMRDSRPNGLFWCFIFLSCTNQARSYVFGLFRPAVFDALKCILMRGMLTSRPSNDQRQLLYGGHQTTNVVCLRPGRRGIPAKLVCKMPHHVSSTLRCYQNVDT